MVSTDSEKGAGSWRAVFEEMPYTAVVSEEYLRSRCSNCFSPAVKRCSKCRTVVYCDDNCTNKDWPWHQIECPALPKLKSSDVRMVARYAVRHRLDGGVASLSNGFPANVKDRTCKDLVSHYRDMKRDRQRRRSLERVWTNWRKHLSNSPLGSMKKSEVERVYCILCINSFSVNDPTDLDEEDPWPTIGSGLYLNVSRFNHSCQPDMVVMFEGVRLSMMKMERPGITDRPVNEKDFNRLTINYGVCATDYYGPSVLLTKQRIESLRSRYYFKCRCPKCTDKLSKELEENASVHQCEHCHKPFVWSGRSKALRPSCKCQKKPAVKVDTIARENVKTLEKRWEEATAEADDDDVMDVIYRCLSVWYDAVQYWHPTNLRMVHLNERMFRALHYKLVKEGDVAEEEKQNLVEMAVKVGEAMLAAYESQMYNDPQLAVLHCQLATIYEMAQGKENVEKAHQQYTKAANVFNTNSDEANAQVVLKWRAKLETGEAKAM